MLRIGTFRRVRFHPPHDTITVNLGGRTGGTHIILYHTYSFKTVAAVLRIVKPLYLMDSAQVFLHSTSGADTPKSYYNDVWFDEDAVTLPLYVYTLLYGLLEGGKVDSSKYFLSLLPFSVPQRATIVS